MKKLVIPPAGPPGPIPSDVTATEPPRQQPEHSLPLNPNDLPLPSSNTEASKESEEEEARRQHRQDGRSER